MTDADPILDTDLDAYVDDQLDISGRIRVENHLAANPTSAARVMADLAMRRTLRLALETAGPVTSQGATSSSQEIREAARRLSAGLSRRRMWSGLQRIAAIGILISVGWLANSSIGPFGANDVIASVHPPAFVEQAIRAHQTTMVREAMPSQPEVRTYDREDIRAATAIVVPEIPEDWQVTDVQVFPSDFGPSVEMSIRTSDGTRMTLFAVRPGYFAVEQIKDLNLAEAEAAYWQIGEVAYAVVSSRPHTGLTDEAELLKTSLH
jgi:anti-sigma factor RsiW